MIASTCVRFPQKSWKEILFEPRSIWREPRRVRRTGRIAAVLTMLAWPAPAQPASAVPATLEDAMIARACASAEQPPENLELVARFRFSRQDAFPVEQLLLSL